LDVNPKSSNPFSISFVDSPSPRHNKDNVSFPDIKSSPSQINSYLAE